MAKRISIDNWTASGYLIAFALPLLLPLAAWSAFGRASVYFITVPLFVGTAWLLVVHITRGGTAHHLARLGDVEGFLQLTNRVRSMNPKSWLGVTPLHYAVMYQHFDLVRAILAASKPAAQFESRDVFGKTPLHIAAESGNVDILKLLLAHGFDPLAVDRRGRSPLSISITRQDAEIMSELSTAAGRRLERKNV